MKIPGMLVIAFSAASLGAAASWQAYVASPARIYPGDFEVRSFEGARRLGVPEQPSAQLAKQISRTFDSNSPRSTLPEEISNWNVALIDGIPYFPYWQDTEPLYRLHPMRHGAFISVMAEHGDIGFYIDKLLSLAHKTPIGGYIWFYPDNYKLSRMVGKVLPSAISQAQILGNLIDASIINNERFAAAAKAAFRGISFDYYQGGVNLEYQAFLEIPLFRSAPEIVLNGWLHALILVNSYADWSKDAEARTLIRKNIKYLATTLDRYHDDRTGLSLYSDLSPYKVGVSYGSKRVPALYAYYDSKSHELDDIVVPLVSIGYPQTSLYDNQIIKREDGYVQVSVNCSQNYDTYLVSDIGGIEVSLWTGRYDPKRATPAAGGDEISLMSAERGNWHVVDLSSERGRLFCGFPTNFGKGGSENYYHVYHIVALAYILATFDLEQGEIRSLKKWMLTWYETVTEFAPSEDMYFSDFEGVLNGLAAHHRRIRYQDWERLFQDAKSR